MPLPNPMNLRFVSLALTFLFFLNLSALQRFAVLSDIHVTPGNENETMLRKVVEEINSAGTFSRVIVDGDLTNEGSDVEIANVKAILDGFTTIPLTVLPGNHENNWSQSGGKTFVDTFGADRFVVEEGDLVLIGINCGPYMKMGDGHIKQEDLHWLDRTLREKTATGNKRVLSFNHYPIMKDDLDNWREYAQVLSQYPVLGHINGHYHKWMKYDTNTDGTGIDCVGIRALKMSDGYGYTIVEVDADSTKIFNKVLGAEPIKQFSFANRTRHKAPEKSINITSEIPDGFEITRLWTDSASVFTRLAIDSENVYFGTSLGDAVAIDKTTGIKKWSLSTGSSSLYGRPVVLNQNKVVFPTCTSLEVIDVKDGALIDKFESTEGPYVADGINNGNVYVQGGYKRMERRDPNNATLIWVYDSLNNYCQAAPVIEGNDLIFGAWDSNLRCLDLETGELKWKWNNGKSANMLGPGNVVPAVTDEKVIIVAPDRYMTALDRTTGRQIWRDKSYKYRESLGISEDKSRVYAKTMDGELVAVSTKDDTFTPLWCVDLGLGYEHAPCIVVEQDGIVYTGSRRGIISAVDPRTATLLWSVPVGVSEVNGLDIDPSTGDIYASLIEGAIIRISHKN